MSADTSPSLRSMLVDLGARPAFSPGTDEVEVETLDLDLSDAALLHRDPPAERSRLVTRGFRAGAVRSWWTGESHGELVARVTLFRVADAPSASLAVADCWSDLAAGKARISRTAAVAVGIVSEVDEDGSRRWTAMSFLGDDDLVVAVFGRSKAEDEALLVCTSLLQTQRELLSSP